MSIKVLNSQVAAKIAAGEVVERPASVVKELLENALDSGARQISIESRGGGLQFIRVSDNGCGISPEDVELAFGRYATSKINRVEDLFDINTLGFRGEALASIVAVAQVEMITSTEDSSIGDFLTLKDSIIIGHVRQAHPKGTTVTVRELFRNVPARFKFMKSVATENSHIANVVSQYALAYPEVRFSLTIDGRNTLQTPGSGNLIDVVIAIYGSETAQKMLIVNGGEVGWHANNAVPISVTGLVASPTVNRGNRDFMSFFVNRRLISSRLLTRAVEEAYTGLIMQNRHPIAIINISIPPSEVDVNIHPTKAEVKFHDDRAMFTAVQKAVRSALVTTAPIPKIEESTMSYTSKPAMTQPLWSTSVRESEPVPQVGQTPRSTLPILRVIGQVASNYIIAEGPDGLYVIDQHAAHERIRYEQINQQKTSQGIQVQGLLEPATLEVTLQEDELLKSGTINFNEFGFDIESFGERTYLVRAIPSVLKDGEWIEALREILDSPRDKNINLTDNIIKSLACHSAVRSGKTMTDEEMRELIRQLEQTNLPNTCPHGRPTILHLPIRQLEKEFGRG